jgi:hypothetical protein
MKAVGAYKMSLYFNDTTQLYISEGSYFYVLRRENLKSQEHGFTVPTEKL